MAPMTPEILPCPPRCPDDTHPEIPQHHSCCHEVRRQRERADVYLKEWKHTEQQWRVQKDCAEEALAQLVARQANDQKLRGLVLETQAELGRLRTALARDRFGPGPCHCCGAETVITVPIHLCFACCGDRSASIAECRPCNHGVR